MWSAIWNYNEEEEHQLIPEETITEDEQNESMFNLLAKKHNELQQQVGELEYQNHELKRKVESSSTGQHIQDLEKKILMLQQQVKNAEFEASQNKLYNSDSNLRDELEDAVARMEATATVKNGLEEALKKSEASRAALEARLQDLERNEPNEKLVQILTEQVKASDKSLLESQDANTRLCAMLQKIGQDPASFSSMEDMITKNSQLVEEVKECRFTISLLEKDLQSSRENHEADIESLRNELNSIALKREKELQNSLHLMRDERNQFQKQNEELVTRNDQWEEWRYQVEEQANVTNQELDSAKDHISSLKAQLQASEGRCVELEQKAKDMSLKLELAPSKSEKDEWDALQKAYTSEIADLKSSLEASSSRIQSQKDEWDAFQKAYTSEIADLKSSLEASSGRIKSCDSEISKLNADNEGLRNCLGEEQRRFEELNIQHSDALKKIDQHIDSEAFLESQIATLQKSKTATDEEARQKDQLLDQLRAQISTISEENDCLQSNILDYKQRIASLTNDLNVNQATIKEERLEAQRINAENISILSRLSSKDIRIGELIEEQEAEKKTALEVSKKAKDCLKTLESQVSELQMTLKEKSDAILNLQNFADRRLSDVQVQLEGVISDRDSIDKKRVELEADNTVLAGRIHALTARLSIYCDLEEQDMEVLSHDAPNLWQLLDDGMEQLRSELDRVNSSLCSSRSISFEMEGPGIINNAASA